MQNVDMYWNQPGSLPDDEMVRLINEMIALELNAARLYSLFQDLFPEDALFWQALFIEEENHANLLKNGRRHFLSKGLFPLEMVPESLDPLVEKNRELERQLDFYGEAPPSREEALLAALGLEQSVGELHYQQAMEGDARTEALKIFQTLNKDDLNHAARIREYMADQGILSSPP
ncbi:MAG: hypothetical protein ED859_08380 [Desulfuromonadales bacterium]|nr:MAG: hypothetical protein ED859_08380 [Desulfuromonadales bacterium]